MKAELQPLLLFVFGLRYYLFQMHRSIDRCLHCPWEGLVAYYSNRLPPATVVAALDSSSSRPWWKLLSLTYLRKGRLQQVRDVLMELSELFAASRKPEARELYIFRVKVGEAHASLPSIFQPDQFHSGLTGTFEHYCDNPWQIPLPPHSFLGIPWPVQSRASQPVVLEPLLARGFWLELYGLRRSLDWARTYFVMQKGSPVLEFEKSGLAEGWPLLAEHYADPRRFGRLQERLAESGAAAEGLSKPFRLFEGLLRLGRTPSLDELAEVHSAFEPAMNLLEVDGRRTALAWRARVRSFDDPEGKEISEILGADWP